MSAGEWIALIGLVLTLLGVFGGGLIYIMRLEGSTKVIATKVNAVEEKVDQVLREIIEAVKTLAIQGVRPSSPSEVPGGWT